MRCIIVESQRKRRNRVTPKQSERKDILPVKHEQLDCQLDAPSTKKEIS